MKQVLDTRQISFEQIETSLFRRLQETFCEIMEEILREMDAALLETRDKKRYEPKDVRSRKIDTLMGQVEIKRRYYRDLKTEEHVALLDERLGIGKRERVSKGLAVAATFLAVQGPSYRGASEALGSMFGYKPVSHESVRQLIMEVSDAAKKWQERRLRGSEGRKKVPMLFVEADGYWVSMQKQNRRKRETRLMVAHEGWRPRSSGSSEYELVEKTYHFETNSGEDFWYDASQVLYSKYAIDDDTVVVINGDRAPWIRKGVEYFPRAIYQVDKFHVKRDLVRYLKDAGVRMEATRAFDSGNPEQLRQVLLRAAKKETDAKTKKGLMGLSKEIAKTPKSFRDYRYNLREMGYEVTGLRGLGAVESSVNRFTNRTRKRGRSWGLAGIEAIMHGLVSRFEGRLETLTRQVSKLRGIMDESGLKRRLEQIPGQVCADLGVATRSAVPIMNAGVTRSGGMSRMFHKLVGTTPAMT